MPNSWTSLRVIVEGIAELASRDIGSALSPGEIEIKSKTGALEQLNQLVMEMGRYTRSGRWPQS